MDYFGYGYGSYYGGWPYGGNEKSRHSKNRENTAKAKFDNVIKQMQTAMIENTVLELRGPKSDCPLKAVPTVLMNNIFRYAVTIIVMLLLDQNIWYICVSYSDIIFHSSFLVMCLEKSTKDWKQRKYPLLQQLLLEEGTTQQLQQQPQAGDVRGRKSTTVN